MCEDGRTAMTKLIFVLRSFAKAPKKESTTNKKYDVFCCHCCQLECRFQGCNAVFSVVHRPFYEIPCRPKIYTRLYGPKIQTTFHVIMYIFLPEDILCLCISSYQTTFHVNMYIFLKEFRTHEKIVLNVTILLQWHGRRNNVEIGSLSVDWFQCRVLQRKVMKCET